MSPEQLEQLKDDLKEHVAATVRTVVNGKIDNIAKKLDTYITDDDEWKRRAEPVVKAFENTSWLFQLFIGTLKILGLLGGAVVAILAIKNFLKQ